MQNPNSDPIDVICVYMTPDGPVEKPDITVPGNSRKTLRVNDILQNTDFSMLMLASGPLVAQRSMYWGEGTELGEACHSSVGLLAPAQTFCLPDGQTSNGFETYTCVSNPNEEVVEIEVTYMTPTGQEDVVFTDTVAPGSRKTFSMADKVEGGRAAVQVRSLNEDMNILVERSMYWNGRGAGTNTIGACPR
jgi:hypothetical protein